MSGLFDLSDDVAVVTGAGRGIGEGIANTLAEAGAAVVCAARRGDEVEAVAAGIRARGGRAIALATDVTDNDAVEALAQKPSPNSDILISGSTTPVGPLSRLR